MTEQELKQQIDNMTQFELCEKWRFAPCGDPLLQGEVGAYFAKKLKEKGGFNHKISKALGWEKHS